MIDLLLPCCVIEHFFRDTFHKSVVLLSSLYLFLQFIFAKVKKKRIFFVFLSPDAFNKNFLLILLSVTESAKISSLLVFQLSHFLHFFANISLRIFFYVLCHSAETGNIIISSVGGKVL